MSNIRFAKTLLLSFSLALSIISTAIALPVSTPVPGGIAIVALKAKADVAPKAYFQKRPVAVLKENGVWYAVAGLGLSTKVGEHFIVSQGQRYPFTVTSKDYPEQHIELKTRKHIDLSAEDLARHRKEKKQATSVFEAFDAQQEPDIAFIKPVAGPYSSPFGLKRFFNGEPRNPHSGLDIAAAKGTPIKAPAKGKVVLTGNFFFNGNVVYIDHGQGVVSMFCHLSEIDVSTGQTLKQGQLVGKVGATGRATGPHLHWSVSLNNARIDPMLLLAE